ncbi:hypothetical protein K458DRAFT_427793 [Lentithecium fluviatile CBS 122367]|uniref:Uncharacterized protein n=1 Tax=Lentithecium fluviatile CBS 122367 TaxID=1168545 RepID=A0A6G1JHQ0_9PLEO|nr:hypothetical protein K458DRAFT_427793 [Lentithecium fluviatile CBS 122367]
MSSPTTDPNGSEKRGLHVRFAPDPPEVGTHAHARSYIREEYLVIEVGRRNQAFVRPPFAQNPRSRIASPAQPNDHVADPDSSFDKFLSHACVNTLADWEATVKGARAREGLPQTNTRSRNPNNWSMPQHNGFPVRRYVSVKHVFNPVKCPEPPSRRTTFDNFVAQDQISTMEKLEKNKTEANPGYKAKVMASALTRKLFGKSKTGSVKKK